MSGLRFDRRPAGSGHRYTLDGARIPGVTTVTGTLAKPALVGWAARKAAEFAIDSWAELSETPVSERLSLITGAANRSSREAMNRGTRVHTFGAKLAAGQDVDVPPELAEPVEAYARFLDRWELTPLSIETPVCHPTYAYGGTLDAIYSSPKLGTILVDIKTGGVFPEVALQLAAYRYATLRLGDEPAIEVGASYVAHVLGDDVELLPIRTTDAEFHAFLYLLSVYRWTAGNADDGPVGRAIHVEDDRDLGGDPGAELAQDSELAGVTR